MRITIDSFVVYNVFDEYHDSIVKNIPTRKEANEFVDIMDDHGYDTSLWTVEPEVQHTKIIS